MKNPTDLKPRMILKLADFAVHYFPTANSEDGYMYALVDSDCDVIFESDDKAEVIREAHEAQADKDEERQQERVEELHAEIIDLVYEQGDEATLKKILAMLRRAQ